MTYQLGLYEKAIPQEVSWEQRFKLAKKAGFDFIELSIDESDYRLERLKWPLDKRLELVNISKTIGIPIRSICLSGHRKFPLGSNDTKKRQQSLNIGYEAIDLASDLGVRLIQLAGYDVYYEDSSSETKEQFVNNLVKLVEYASAREVVLAFETMETPFMDTVQKAMHFVDKISSPWLGVYPDIGNLSNAAKKYDHTVNDDLETGRGHIFAAHLKETREGEYREVPFGKGHTEFAKNIAQLKDLGVRSFVGEFWYVGQEDWEQDLFFAGEFLREKIEEGFSRSR